MEKEGTTVIQDSRQRHIPLVYHILPSLPIATRSVDNGPAPYHPLLFTTRKLLRLPALSSSLVPSPLTLYLSHSRPPVHTSFSRPLPCPFSVLHHHPLALCLSVSLPRSSLVPSLSRAVSLTPFLFCFVPPLSRHRKRFDESSREMAVRVREVQADLEREWIVGTRPRMDVLQWMIESPVTHPNSRHSHPFVRALGPSHPLSFSHSGAFAPSHFRIPLEISLAGRLHQIKTATFNVGRSRYMNVGRDNGLGLMSFGFGRPVLFR